MLEGPWKYAGGYVGKQRQSFRANNGGDRKVLHLWFSNLRSSAAGLEFRFAQCYSGRMQPSVCIASACKLS